MTDYVMVLTANYPNDAWALNANDYSTLQWFSDTPKPTQAQLDEQWPTVEYNQEILNVQTARRLAYETLSDGLFFEWQRGDGTEAAWRAAVAKIKTTHPYPPQP
jgi:hypothetical protein